MVMKESWKHIYDAAIYKKPDTFGAIAPRMIAYSSKKCHELGIKTIVSQAEGNRYTKNTVGYRYWPKLGFNARISGAVTAKLPPRFRTAETLLDLYEMEGGEEAWRLVGIRCKMYFDTQQIAFLESQEPRQGSAERYIHPLTGEVIWA